MLAAAPFWNGRRALFVTAEELSRASTSGLDTTERAALFSEVLSLDPKQI
jgi:hypothetical protein